MPKVNSATPHDKLFKRFLLHKAYAAEFLKAYLPAHILKLCDLTTLKPENTNFISIANRACYSDVLYSLNVKGKCAYIYILIEHQAQPDALMVLRAIRYQMEVIYHHVENHKTAKYPLVIPMVFYTGSKKWNYPLKLTSYFEDEKLAAEVLFEGINLIQLHNISDAEIFKHKELSVLEIVQKHLLEKDAKKLGRLIGKALESGSKISDDLATYVLRYTLEEGKLEDPDEYLEFISEQLPEYREIVMNAGEKLVERGMHVKAAEIAKNFIATGVDLTTIAKCTGFSQKELKELAKQEDTTAPTKSRKSSKH